MSSPKIPRVIECGDCGRLCEAPLMEDADVCCRVAIAEALVEWAEARVLDDDQLTAEGREAIRPVVMKMASDYISKVLRINPASILGKNKNDG